MNRWFPVARGEEVILRHIVQTQLLGQEIAVWRDDRGAVNAWANRCPHRGVRLSIGINTGDDLRCRYHGWRFATMSGQCLFIPAHPSQKPASTLHATAYGAVERHGYIWANLDGEGEPPVMPITAETSTTLRSIFVNASAAAVAEGLLPGYRIDADTLAPVHANDAFTYSTAAGSGAPRATFLLQPLTDSQTVIHGIVEPRAADAQRIAVLRHHNAQLTLLRDDIERVTEAR